MKKRVFSALLALVLALSAAVLPASAADTFSDVTDKKTAQNVEILHLLGVIDGNGAGQFRPNDTLTRAEFCKMLVVMMGGDEAARYKTVTIFPDVRASHWAAGYINYAVRGQKLLAGLPDGTFRPDSNVTYGQAATILMRLLGYSDKDTGGIWPDGYIALAKEMGVSAGVNLSGSSAITRAQAAQMFVNVLGAKSTSSSTNKEGVTTPKTYTPSGCTRKSGVTLISLNGNTARVSGADKASYNLVRTSTSTVLNGLKGDLLLNADGKVMTFVPVVDSSTGTAVTNAAVILPADGSTNGISALTGGRTDYDDVYRNGVPTTVSALRKNDVVTYDAAANALYACDTRVTVYYEKCDTPSAPTTIEVLGGTQFDVLPTAQQSLAKFKPGKTMTLLLTNDGAVAGAVEGDYSVRGNAIGIVDAKGTVQMFCGSTMKKLSLTDMTVDSSLYGKLVSISSSAAKSVNLYAQSGGVSGSLNVSERKLDGKALAANVMVYRNGELISLSELTETVIPQSQIAYARMNADGQIDLIVLESAGKAIYGRVTEVKETPMGSGEMSYTKREITIDTNGSKPMKETGYIARVGDFVEAVEKDGKFTPITVLTKLEKVARSSWIGTGAVNFGGMTYTVPADMLCWNADVNDWFDGSVEAALAYGGTMNLYVKDGIVRVIEVRS